MQPIDRFSGTSGFPNLIAAFLNQVLVHGDRSVADELAKVAKVLQFESGTRLIAQDDADNDIYFILFGEVSIHVNGREMARRQAGQHIGEMAVIDPAARRAATVQTRTEVVIARVTCEDFSKLANSHPELWRRIASELGNRLRQRTAFVRPKNETPVFFIGSSAESLPVVQALASRLVDAPFIVRPWTGRVFTASQFPIDDLAAQLNECDFAALVLGPDDEVLSRGVTSDAPRDNVLFELGLFMGAIDRSRTFLVVPSDIEVKIPTDLMGLNQLRFNLKSGDLLSNLAPVCDSLRELVNRLGAR